ncbi:MAG: polyhydroxyalkanoate synthesis repressor PhaR [Hyphomicrobium sp.]
MQTKPETQPEKREAVVIKKYANRRLYNTETSTYVTLEDLAQMVRADRDFVVYDAKSGDDLTHAVLTQIIVEQESREGGQTLLPIPFLRQLIRFYDDQMGRMVPSYLQFSLESLVKEQEKFRSQLTNAFTNPATAFEIYQDQARRNIALFEQAMTMWTSLSSSGAQPGIPFPNPFAAAAPAAGRAGAKSAANPAAPAQPASESKAVAGTEIDELKMQLSAMQQRIERLSRDNS